MNRASRQEAAASEIARLRGEVEVYAEFLGQPAARFLDVDFISHLTGITPDRVRELLGGALPEVEPDDKADLEALQDGLFLQRLRFLRETRLKALPTGEEQPYSLRDIERGTGISYQHVSNLFSGKRGANAAHCARLERFFDQASQQRTPPSRVHPGFCLRNEGSALIAHLEEMTSADLPRLALATLVEDLGTTSVALRSGAGDLDVTKLLPVLAQLRTTAREQSVGRDQ